MANSMDPKSQKEYDALMIRKQNTEDHVVDVLHQRAISERWDVEKHVGSDAGCDLRLEKDGRVVFIEAKGERENQKPATQRVQLAIGQIIMRMEKDNPNRINSFCMAFPDTDNFRKIVDKIPPSPRNTLRLSVFLVDCPKNSIKLLRSGSSKYTKLNNFEELFYGV